MQTVEQVLKNCTVNGLVVKLPNIKFEREFYEQIKAKLEGIGGKWKGGRVQGFVFKHNPSELLNQIANGTEINLQQDYQFIPTPDKLADKLVEIAMVGLSESDILHPQCFLEPSGGDGQIIRAIWRYVKSKFLNVSPIVISTYELMERNKIILGGMKNVILLGDNFLKTPIHIKYKRIIANPPFTRNQDIDHIYRMWMCLEKGGRIVAIASQHWLFANDKKSQEFRKWLEFYKAKQFKLPYGSFENTPVGAVVLVIDKDCKLPIPKIDFGSDKPTLQEEQLPSVNELLDEMSRLDGEVKEIMRSLRNSLSTCNFVDGDPDNPIKMIDEMLEDGENISQSLANLKTEKITYTPGKLDELKSEILNPVVQKITQPVQLSLF